MRMHAAVVTEKKTLNGGYVFLKLEPSERFSFSPGQHVLVEFVDEHGTFERYFSIACAPQPDNHIELCIQGFEERLKRKLQQLQENDTLNFVGPSGDFRLNAEAKEHVFIAGGTGIAPIRSFIQILTENLTRAPYRPLTLIYGCKDAAGFPLAEEFLEYHHLGFPNVKVCLTAEAGVLDGIKSGRVTHHLPEDLEPAASYYLCGPPGMIDAVTAELLNRGVPATNIHVERFAK